MLCGSFYCNGRLSNIIKPMGKTQNEKNWSEKVENS